MPASATIKGLAAPLARRPSVSVRLWARLRAWRLDRELARGVEPGSDPVLTLHAKRLLSPQSRARIADALEEVLRDANADEPVRPGAQVPLWESAILAARSELEGLVVTLRADRDCHVRGVALARLLVIDGGSPLHGPGSERELVAAARQARYALRCGEPR